MKEFLAINLQLRILYTFFNNTKKKFQETYQIGEKHAPRNSPSKSLDYPSFSQKLPVTR